MPIPQITLIFAAILFVLGAGAYAATLSITAAIPAVLGVLLGICGGLSLAKPDWRKHLMHVASVLALLGVILPLVPLIMRLVRGEVEWGVGLFSLLSMLVLSVALLVIYIRSFIAARRQRQTGEAVSP